MNYIAENIKYLRKNKGITQEQLANKIGVKRSNIGAYEENRAEPKLRVLLNICHYFNIDVDSIITKKIENNSTTQKIDIEGNQLRILSILVDNENDKELISVVPVKAAAGYLNGYGDVDFIEKLQKFNLPVQELSPERTYRVFQISGDSMLPVKPKSYIICEYVHDWFDIKNEQCYILVTREDGIVYKRVINNLKDGHLLLKSDNQEYSPFKIQPEKIIEVWKALGFISFKLPDTDELIYGNNNLNNLVKELKGEISSIKTKINNVS